MVQRSIDRDHPPVCKKDFQTTTKGLNHCKFKIKICEALFVKKHRPTQNAQEHSVTLKLEINLNLIEINFTSVLSHGFIISKIIYRCIL